MKGIDQSCSQLFFKIIFLYHHGGKDYSVDKKVTDELICRYQIHYAMDKQAEILLHLYNY